MKQAAFLYLFAFALAFSACTGNKTAEFEKARSLEYIDSLYNDLFLLKTKLDKVDFADIAERYAYIDAELDLIERYSDSSDFDSETTKILTEYKGLAQIYHNFSRHGKTIVTEAEELFIQLKTLRKSVEEGNYAKEDFKVYLGKQAEEIKELVEYANAHLSPVIETENLFFKRMEQVELLTKKIKVKQGLRE